MLTKSYYNKARLLPWLKFPPISVWFLSRELFGSQSTFVHSLEYNASCWQLHSLLLKCTSHHSAYQCSLANWLCITEPLQALGGTYQLILFQEESTYWYIIPLAPGPGLVKEKNSSSTDISLVQVRLWHVGAFAHFLSLNGKQNLPSLIN